MKTCIIFLSLIVVFLTLAGSAAVYSSNGELKVQDLWNRPLFLQTSPPGKPEQTNIAPSSKPASVLSVGGQENSGSGQPILSTEGHDISFEVKANNLVSDYDVQILAQTWGKPTLVQSGGDYPQMSIDPSDKIFASWPSCRGYSCPALVRRSDDGGLTWSNPMLAANGAPWPHALLAGDKGNVYVAWTSALNETYPLLMSRSTDYGNTFDFEVRIDDGSNNSYYGPDLAQDSQGNLYAVWSYVDVTWESQSPNGIFFAKSTNGGNSFGPTIRVNDIPNSEGIIAWRPSIAVAPNGIIYVIWEEYRWPNLGNVYFTKSTDGGSTFVPSQSINEISPMNFSTSFPESSLGLYGNDRVYIVWSDDINSNKDIYFTRSVNGGISFESSIKLNDDTGSRKQYLPALAIGSEGQILVTWYDERNTTTLRGDIYSTFSIDGGMSFAVNSRVNPDIGSVTYQTVFSPAFDSEGKPHVIWAGQMQTCEVDVCIYHSAAQAIQAPFLDLPFKYVNFAQAAQGNTGRSGGRVNSWFDHNLPNGSSNNTLDRWNGQYSGNASVNVNTCEITLLSCYDGHNAIDFRRHEPDEPVLAAAPGIVLDTVESNSGYGNRVWIDHENGYATLYAHLKSVSSDIEEGTTRVVSGQQIGIMGNTGVSVGSTGIHLHFGVYYDQNGDGKWKEDEVVDPFGWQPLDKPTNRPDPWTISSHYLWKHALNDQAIADGNGGSVDSVSGIAAVTVPTGALSSPVMLDLWEAPPVAGASAQLRSPGYSIWFRVLEWLSGESTRLLPTSAPSEFNQPVTIEIDYSEADLLHLNESQLAIYWWDETNSEWEMLPTTVNTSQKRATAQTTQTGNFDLQAPLLCQFDVSEPDDDYYTATSIQPDGTLWNQSLGVAQDEDWFKFEGTADSLYTLKTAGLATGVNTIIEIYDHDGVTLLTSEENSSLASQLQWAAPETGTYFVRLLQNDNNVYGCSSTYMFSINYLNVSGSNSVFLPVTLRLP